MKIRIKKLLEIRKEPNLTSDSFMTLAPDSLVTVDPTLYSGDTLDGSDQWYKDQDGNYYPKSFVENYSTEDINEVEFSIDNFWWLKEYNIDKLWNANDGNVEIKIAVLDTGLDFNHNDLNIDLDNTKDVTHNSTLTDYTGHGTQMTGIINAIHNNYGIYGIAPDAKLYFAKITSDFIGDQISFLIKGIQWAIDEDVDIISISKGWETGTDSLANILDLAKQNNILVIASAGNQINGVPNSIQYPSKYSSVLSVGGVKENRNILDSTIDSNNTDIFAPGEEILSTYLHNGYSKGSGSSQATAYIAGVSAILLQIVRKDQPHYKALQLKDHLITTSDNEPFGKLINPLNALNHLS